MGVFVTAAKNAHQRIRSMSVPTNDDYRMLERAVQASAIVSLVLILKFTFSNEKEAKLKGTAGLRAPEDTGIYQKGVNVGTDEQKEAAEHSIRIVYVLCWSGFTNGPTPLTVTSCRFGKIFVGFESSDVPKLRYLECVIRH
jgi:delta-aminolevulinic acid dehydratase/porphobilinogen synthase